MDALVAEIISRHKHTKGALLPILHDLQDNAGHVPLSVIPAIAKELNLSVAEIHGVVTYYHHFRTEPVGKNLLRLCQAEACLANGAKPVADHAKQRLGCEFGQTSSDAKVTIESAYCLGLCAVGPAALLNETDLVSSLTKETLDALLCEITERK